MKHSTYFGLFAEFGTAEIKLEDCCEKFFGLNPAQAKRRAAEGALPVKAYRMSNSQKSGWIISIADLASHIDSRKAEAEKLFKAMSGGSRGEGSYTGASSAKIRAA